MSGLIVIFLAVVLIYLYCAVAPQRLIFDSRQDTLFHTPGDITLSFDDGPDPAATPAILDLLKKHNKKACFFLVGERVQQHPEIAQRILQEGHTIGNHSTSHCSMLFSRYSRIVHEIDTCQKSIMDATGFTPRLIRPPYGQRDFRFYRHIRKLGLKCMLWSIDSFDYLHVSTETLAKRFARAKQDDIILAHDRTFGNKDAQAVLDKWLTTNG